MTPFSLTTTTACFQSKHSVWYSRDA